MGDFFNSSIDKTSWSFVTTKRLWYLTHTLHSFSLHIKQNCFASSSSPSLWQPSQKFPCEAWDIFRSLSLVGKSFAQSFNSAKMFSAGMKSRQRGQENPTGDSFERHEDSMWFFKHSWQNEWKHGRHFGDLKSSKQMEHFVKSLQILVSLFTLDNAMPVTKQQLVKRSL